MPRDDARAEKSTQEELGSRRVRSRLAGLPPRSGYRATNRRRRARDAPEFAEPTNGAGAANAVADFRLAGPHDVLTPGTHKGGQATRGIDGFLHDWEIGQHASWDVQVILTKGRGRH